MPIQTILKINEVCQEFFLNALHHSTEGTTALSYCSSRKMDQRKMEWLRLGCCPSSLGCQALRNSLRSLGLSNDQIRESGMWKIRPDGSLSPSLMNRLTIPIMNEAGQVVAFTARAIREGQQPRYLNTDTTALYKKGEELYNMDRARLCKQMHKGVVLVEGCIKAEAVNRVGYKCVVATQGTALTESQCYALASLSHEVTIAFDGDAAGAAATEKAIPMLLALGLGVKVAKMVGGGPDDMLAAMGSMALVAALGAAREWNQVEVVA